MSITIATVTITRAEGQIGLDDFNPHTFDSMIEANSYLRDMALTAPNSGGSDKVDFKVTFEDEQSYTGTYDLKQEDMATGDLSAHMRAFVRFNTGRHCPEHLTPEQYQEFTQRFDTGKWIDFLCTYDF